VRALRARLAPGQRLLLVIGLAGVLAAASTRLAAIGSPGSSPLGPAAGTGQSSGFFVAQSPGLPGWARLLIFLAAIAAWAALSVPLLTGLPATPGDPGSGTRLSLAQRVVLVIGLGAALAAAGSWATASAVGTPGWYAYAPLTNLVFPPPAGLPGWEQAVLWLLLAGAWAAASWRLLGRRLSYE
jgi:hypothetical protein